MTQHLTWIECLKGICMICVYLCHSEWYYGVEGEWMGFWERPFYVNAFFFVSGYVFFGKWLERATPRFWLTCGRLGTESGGD